MTGAEPLLMAVKLALVGAVVLASSLAAQRFGHLVSGLLAGMPMIAGPITGLLLTDLPAARVRDVALATLVCQPALVVYLVVFAHAAQRWRWPACLAAALLAFALSGLALLQPHWPEALRVALALAAPLLGLRALPRQPAQLPSPIVLPRLELALRVAVALVVAAGVMWGARHLGPAFAGLLLATPIAGIVLPSFTLPRHGPQATVLLLAGFARGQAGFVVFFVALLIALPRLPAGWAWLLSMAASGLAALGVRRLLR